MFWHLILFSPLYLMFALLFCNDQARLVVALYQQVFLLWTGIQLRPTVSVRG